MKRQELLIEADELLSDINDPALRVFDATIVFDPNAESAETRYRKGHIPGAAFLDHNALSRSDTSLMYMLPEEEALGQAIGTLGIGNDNPVVVYSTDMIACATRIWWVLRYAGHRNVRVLNGGISAWQGDLETTEQTHPATTFSTSLSPRMFASKDEVLEAVKAGDSCVVNTLPPEIYRGESGLPYDGHISGTANHPRTEYTDGDFMRSTEDIAASFKNKDTGKRLITYCGGGIAATVNACAAKLASIEEVAVYDGSMSEWLAEGLPVTQGAETGSIP